MVLTISIIHIFKFPTDETVKLFFKHREEFRQLDGKLLKSIDGTHTYNESDGISCSKTNLIYESFIPKFLRTRVPEINSPEIELEEEAWVDLAEHHYWFRYRNITWNDSMNLLRTTAFTADAENPKWTRIECDAGVSVEAANWDHVGEGIEHFLQRHLKTTIEKSIALLTQKIEDYKNSGE